MQFADFNISKLQCFSSLCWTNHDDCWISLFIIWCNLTFICPTFYFIFPKNYFLTRITFQIFIFCLAKNPVFLLLSWKTDLKYFFLKSWRDCPNFFPRTLLAIRKMKLKIKVKRKKRKKERKKLSPRSFVCKTAFLMLCR